MVDGCDWQLSEGEYDLIRTLTGGSLWKFISDNGDEIVINLEGGGTVVSVNNAEVYKETKAIEEVSDG